MLGRSNLQLIPWKTCYSEVKWHPWVQKEPSEKRESLELTTDCRNPREDRFVLAFCAWVGVHWYWCGSLTSSAVGCAAGWGVMDSVVWRLSFAVHYGLCSTWSCPHSLLTWAVRVSPSPQHHCQVLYSECMLLGRTGVQSLKENNFEQLRWWLLSKCRDPCSVLAAESPPWRKKSIFHPGRHLLLNGKTPQVRGLWPIQKPPFRTANFWPVPWIPNPEDVNTAVVNFIAPNTSWHLVCSFSGWTYMFLHCPHLLYPVFPSWAIRTSCCLQRAKPEAIQTRFSWENRLTTLRRSLTQSLTLIISQYSSQSITVAPWRFHGQGDFHLVCLCVTVPRAAVPGSGVASLDRAERYIFSDTWQRQGLSLWFRTSWRRR